jgi:serine/threonine protein kinase
VSERGDDTALRDFRAAAEALGNRTSAEQRPDPVVAESAAIPAALSIPDVVIEKALGHGGMGAVFAGRSLSLDRPVAIKVIHPELARHESFVLRFEREARALAKLSHPNIVTCFQTGQARGGERYLLMELVSGEDLSSWVRDRGVLGVRDALGIARQIADALAYAQEKGLIHRDVKPENILLETGTARTRPGTARFRAKLVDLGLAVPGGDTARQLKITQTGSIMASPLTMAPEQAESPESVDHRADIYALGATLYYALVGQYPHEGTTYGQILARKVKGSAPDPRHKRAELSEGVVRLVLRMLRYSADERHRTYDELLNELDALLDATASTTRAPVVLSRKTHRLRWVGLVMLSVTLGLVLASRVAGWGVTVETRLQPTTVRASAPPVPVNQPDHPVHEPKTAPAPVASVVDATDAMPTPEPPSLAWAAPRRILGGSGALFADWEVRPRPSSWQAAEEEGVCDGVAEGADEVALLELKSLPAPPWRWRGAFLSRSAREAGVHLTFDAQALDVAIQELGSGTWFLRISRSDGERHDPLALLTLTERSGARRDVTLVHAGSCLWARLDGGPSAEGETWARARTPGPARRAGLYVKKGAASFDTVSLETVTR